ncbi:hypothetical protein EIN_189150, partial [Entamoeba invadens IP1]
MNDICNNYEDVADYVNNHVFDELCEEFENKRIVIHNNCVGFGMKKATKNTRKTSDRFEGASGSDNAEEAETNLEEIFIAELEETKRNFRMDHPCIKSLFFKSREIFSHLFEIVASLQEDNCLLFEYIERMEMFQIHVD